MAKQKYAYFCGECGGEEATWKGQCSHCGAWNSIKQEPIESSGSKNNRGARTSWTGDSTDVILLDHVTSGGEAQRFSSGIGEFDRALGGGLVVGGVVLLSGDPGIGKSTLLLQTVSSCHTETKLYVTGEESIGQVADRGRRLNASTKNVQILAETELEKILNTAKKVFQNKKGILVIDSIQTLYSENIPSAPGTVTQVRECAAQLTRFAKQTGVTLILIGHVTKDGNVAGPRVLEHLVDTVLYFEGDPQTPYRLIRAFKNRFGAAQELGAFEMTEDGLISIDNPSALFLNHDRQKTSGSAIFAYQEGTRPILLEIQALVTDMQANNPKRLTIGVEINRLSMILAVLHKHGSAQINDQDVFLNVVGGLKIQETASDLPMLFALVSSLRNKPVPLDVLSFGEIGLTGEVRSIQRAEERLKEGARLGFKHAIIPFKNMPKKPIPGIQVYGVKNLSEAINRMTDLENKS